MAIDEIRTKLKKLRNKERAKASQSYFKTGFGKYAEGDVFLGIKGPDLRKLAKEYRDIPLSQVGQQYLKGKM